MIFCSEQGTCPELCPPARFSPAEILLFSTSQAEIFHKIHPESGKLDGWTHRKESEAEADKFKDEACKEAGITIVRIDYQEMNYPDKMLEKIVKGY